MEANGRPTVELFRACDAFEPLVASSDPTGIWMCSSNWCNAQSQSPKTVEVELAQASL